MNIAIIGAGASGMAAAIAAAENPNAQVILLERHARVGRKLLATGNGRCNLTNLHASEGGYHGDDVSFADSALSALNPEATRAWFRSLGLYTVAEPSGRVYPYSDQANSVVDILRFALVKPNIRLETGFEVCKIKKVDGEFQIFSADTQITAQRVIVACGGLAGTKLGGSMSGYRLLSKLGHSCTRLRPSLVQLKTDWSGVAALKGVRTNCHAAVFHDRKLHSESTGELQFTDYGISGPVIFDLSRDVCRDSGVWECYLDFLPDISADALTAELMRRRRTMLPSEEVLTGIVHNRLGKVLAKSSGISAGRKISELDDEQVHALCGAVKQFVLPLKEPMGMDCAQVTAGGIRTDEFDPATMESWLVHGLYACGEVLDIDGDCGGYNLQWAWSSGYCAGKSAGKDTL